MHNVRPGVGFVLVAFTGLFLAGAVAGAQQSNDDRYLRANVNSAGELHDESGRLVGKVMMSSPERPFDIRNMKINSDGSVVDSSGAAVGRLSLGPGSTAGAPAPRVNESTGMPPGYQPELIGPGRGAAVQQAAPARPAPTATSTVRQKPKVVMGISDEEFNSRRAKVSGRIDSNLAEGRITEEQAAELKGDLQRSDESRAGLGRHGILSDKDVMSVYKKWDRIMGKLDEYLARNARSAIGLRTK